MCISSVCNLARTLMSSLCQFWLRVGLGFITNGYLLVCDLQEWSSKGSKMQSSLAIKNVVKSKV